MYVGEDKKLHFVDSEGADSVLPFSAKSSYNVVALEFTDSVSNGVIYYYTYNVVNRSAIKLSNTNGGSELTVRNISTDGVYSTEVNGLNTNIYLSDCTTISFEVVTRSRGINLSIEVI